MARATTCKILILFTLLVLADSGRTGDDYPVAVAINPAGTLVFVTGFSSHEAGDQYRYYDWATLALKIGDGTDQWLGRHNGTADGWDAAHSMAISPDGNVVYVTGFVCAQTKCDSEANYYHDIVTIASYASNGTRKWLSSYNHPVGNYRDVPNALAVSRSGRQLVVAGYATAGTAGGLDHDFVIVSYNATSAVQQWSATYNNSAVSRGSDVANAVVFSPDGQFVYVTGQSASTTNNFVVDFATLSYWASNGTRKWLSRYDGPANGADNPVAIGMGSSNDYVYVTGKSVGTNSGFDYATLSYRTSNGTQRWIKRYNGPPDLTDDPLGMNVTRDGKIIVTGYSQGGGDNKGDFLTIGYTSSGTDLWQNPLRYNRGATIYNSDDSGKAIVVSPDRNYLYVAGYTTGDVGVAQDMTVVAYAMSDGSMRWAPVHYNYELKDDRARGIAITPDGNTIVVVGNSEATTKGYDYAIVAYRTSDGASLWSRRYDGASGGDFVVL